MHGEMFPHPHGHPHHPVYMNVNSMQGHPTNAMNNHFNSDYVIRVIRSQIEFWFSDSNLSRDNHLRSLMDMDGFVELQQIAKFNRLRNMRVSFDEILEAAKTSTMLDVRYHNHKNSESGSWASKVNVTARTDANADKVSFVGIRPKLDPLRWITPDISSLQDSKSSG